jgi:hypothetical protein
MSQDLNVEVRQRAISMVVEALSALSIPPPSLHELQFRLQAGEEVGLVEGLGLDSLGAMEFCIHLELQAGLVVTPEELIGSGSTPKLLLLLESRLVRNVAGDQEGQSDCC